MCSSLPWKCAFLWLFPFTWRCMLLLANRKRLRALVIPCRHVVYFLCGVVSPFPVSCFLLSPPNQRSHMTYGGNVLFWLVLFVWKALFFFGYFNFQENVPYFRVMEKGLGDAYFPCVVNFLSPCHPPFPSCSPWQRMHSDA